MIVWPVVWSEFSQDRIWANKTKKPRVEFIERRSRENTCFARPAKKSLERLASKSRTRCLASKSGTHQATHLTRFHMHDDEHGVCSLKCCRRKRQEKLAFGEPKRQRQVPLRCNGISARSIARSAPLNLNKFSRFDKSTVIELVAWYANCCLVSVSSPLIQVRQFQVQRPSSRLKNVARR